MRRRRRRGIHDSGGGGPGDPAHWRRQEAGLCEAPGVSLVRHPRAAIAAPSTPRPSRARPMRLRRALLFPTAPAPALVTPGCVFTSRPVGARPHLRGDITPPSLARPRMRAVGPRLARASVRRGLLGSGRLRGVGRTSGAARPCSGTRLPPSGGLPGPELAGAAAQREDSGSGVSPSRGRAAVGVRSLAPMGSGARGRPPRRGVRSFSPQQTRGRTEQPRSTEGRPRCRPGPSGEPAASRSPGRSSSGVWRPPQCVRLLLSALGGLKLPRKNPPPLRPPLPFRGSSRSPCRSFLTHGSAGLVVPAEPSRLSPYMPTARRRRYLEAGSPGSAAEAAGALPWRASAGGVGSGFWAHSQGV